MDLPQVIEWQGQRVLTTKQIAEAYGTTMDIIKWNFHYNRNRYQEGKHFYELKGDSLREAKREIEIQPFLKQAKCVHLWTEKGTLLHAKSLNTDKAWEVYDYLVDFYFHIKEVALRQQASKPKGKEVVDIPVNEKAQSMMQQLREELAGMESLLRLYNKYQSEEDFKKIAHTIGRMGLMVGDTSISISLLKPNIVEKIF